MLITFERVWAVGRFDVGRIVFSSCHKNHELEQSPAGGILEPVRGTPVRNVSKRGTIVPKRGTSLLGRDGGVYPRESIPKRGTWSHPTFDHSRLPAIHWRKKEKKRTLWMLGRSPRSTTNAADFYLESI